MGVLLRENHSIKNRLKLPVGCERLSDHRLALIRAFNQLSLPPAQLPGKARESRTASCVQTFGLTTVSGWSPAGGRLPVRD